MKTSLKRLNLQILLGILCSYSLAATGKNPQAYILGKDFKFGDEITHNTELSSIVIGDEIKFSKDNSTGENISNTIIGKEVTVIKSTGSKVIASESTVEDSEFSINIGNKNTVTNSGSSVALGNYIEVKNSKYAVAIGNNAKVISNSKGINSSVAIGAFSEAKRTNKQVKGVYLFRHYNGEKDKNIGKEQFDYNNDHYALEKDKEEKINKLKYMRAWAPDSYSAEFSIGHDVNERMEAKTRQLTHVAAGSEDWDAVNVAQLKSLEIMHKDAEDINAEKYIEKLTAESNKTKLITDAMLNEALKSSNSSNAVKFKALENGSSINKSNYIKKLSDGANLDKPSGVLVTDKQVSEYINKNVSSSMSSIEEKIKKNSIEMENMIKESSAASLSGVSSAVAMANLPSGEGNNQLGVSYGFYKGFLSVALGYSGKFKNLSYKVSTSLNNNSNVSFRFGVGYIFDKIKEVNNIDNEIVNKKISELENENKELKLKLEKLERKFEKIMK